MTERRANGITPKVLRPYTLGPYRFGRRIIRGLRSAVSRVNPRPILVLGNQKSGTTAIAALLAEATGLSVTLDLQREVDEPTFPRVRTGGMSFDDFIRRNRLDFSRRIVKEPNLTLFPRELRDRFPESPIVFIIRDPRDNIRSILDRLGLPGDCDCLGDERWATVSEAWRTVLDNRWLGIEHEHYVAQLAGRWRFAAETHRASADAR